MSPAVRAAELAPANGQAGRAEEPFGPGARTRHEGAAEAPNG